VYADIMANNSTYSRQTNPTFEPGAYASVRNFSLVKDEAIA